MTTGDPIVIVGAALTGGTAAAALRHEGFDGPITLIGAEPRHPYERPPLSKSLLRGETPFDEALVNPEASYADEGIELRLGMRATAIDPRRRRVTMHDGEEVPFERLLLATGARNRRFPIPGLDLPGVHALRTVEECEAIRADADSGSRAVVAGMGFIGSEVAASLRRLGVEVTAIDGGAVPLERVLGPEVGRVLAGIHRDHGVRLVSNDRLRAFEGSGRVECAVTASGERLGGDFAVVGLGVEPATELAVAAGLQVDNGILVDARFRTSEEGIFAAGDVANLDHPLFGRRLRVEHWQNARKQGRAAALAMLGAGAPFDEVPWFWSDQYDHNIQYAGHHTEWDDFVVRGSLDDRSFLGFYRKDGRVQSVVGMNRGSDVLQAAALIRSGGLADPDLLRDDDLPVRSLGGAEAAHGGPHP